jgi:anaerobic selenocysteine-containing dehydrogenase
LRTRCPTYIGFVQRTLKVLLLLGTNMLSSFADARRVADGLNRAETVVCVDLFMNETARRFADVVVPGTAWLKSWGSRAAVAGKT